MKEIENLAKWYRLDMKVVNEAEQRMGFSFPKSLRTVYQKYGYGFVTNTEGAINRLMDPLTCADIRLREDIYECDPDLELYESSETDKILFFVETVPTNDLIGRIAADGGPLRRFKIEIISNIVGAGQSVFCGFQSRF